MSQFKQTGIRPVSSRLTGFRATVTALISRATQRWQRGQAAAALHRLDDRQLEDIGISRNDIPRVVAGLVPSNIETSSQDVRIATHAARLLSAARMQ
jgi:uncharacterized protein YjiS (DUF1127 family)